LNSHHSTARVASVKVNFSQKLFLIAVSDCIVNEAARNRSVMEVKVEQAASLLKKTLAERESTGWQPAVRPR